MSLTSRRLPEEVTDLANGLGCLRTERQSITENVRLDLSQRTSEDLATRKFEAIEASRTLGDWTSAIFERPSVKPAQHREGGFAGMIPALEIDIAHRRPQASEPGPG